MNTRTFLIGLLLVSAGCLAAAPYRAKLLHTGWDLPDNHKLKAHYQEMEKVMPFDGVVLIMTNPKCSVNTLYPWHPTPWPEDALDEAADDVRSCNFQRFTDNFILTWVSPGPVDWFDDQAWHTIAHKFGLIARAAKKANCKGICFDPEPYNDFNWQYKADGKHSLAETRTMVRQRGREIMTAIAKEYPDMTFLTYWMLSLVQLRNDQANDPYWGMYQPFIDGLWSAVPPEMTVVDGAESGYTIASQIGALRSSQRIHLEYGDFLSPENRSRYRRQIRSGFGFYLDPYVDPRPGWIKLDGTQLVTLFHNMNYLLSAADGYVWFYCEKGRYFDPENTKEKWENQLPGLDLTLRMARHPEQFKEALRSAAAEKKIPNRWPNPELDQNFEPLKAPHRSDWRLVDSLPGFEAWFEGETAPVTIADGALQLENGISLLVPVAVTPGSVYNIDVPFQCSEGVSLSGVVGFITPEGDWLEMDNALCEKQGTDAGVRHLELLLGPVPDGAAQMIIVLSKLGPGDAGPVSIRKASVYCLDDLLPAAEVRK